MTVRTPPFNLKKHRVLLATGYKYKRHEANFYNNYNTKNNIEIQTPAYDKYTSERNTFTLMFQEKSSAVNFVTWKIEGGTRDFRVLKRFITIVKAMR